MDDMVWLMRGDCLERMREIPAGSVDLVLCDLPYGITQSPWDKPIPLEPLWEAYHRVCKERAAVVLHGREPFTSDLVCSNRKEFKYKWTWYKKQCSGFLNAKRQPLQNCEDIVVFYRKMCTYNPQMREGKTQPRMSGTSSACYGKFNFRPHSYSTHYPTTLLEFTLRRFKGGHPAQKPVELLEYLIRTYTNPGDTVLDNCMGAGSTGVACVNLGRRFIGIELNDIYFQSARKRIEEAQNAAVSG